MNIDELEALPAQLEPTSASESAPHFHHFLPLFTKTLNKTGNNCQPVCFVKMVTHRCPYCDKVCKSARGLTQHINAVAKCRDLQAAAVGKYQANALPNDPFAAVATKPVDNRPETGRLTRQKKRARLDDEELDPTESENPNMEDPIPHPNDNDPDADDDLPELHDRDLYDSDDEEDPNDEDPDATDAIPPLVARDPYDSDDDEDDFSPVPDAIDGKTTPNTEILSQFREYCMANEWQVNLTEEETSSIKLMDVLRQKKAPLNAYASVLEWHLHETNHLREHETLKDTDAYCHRSTLMKLMVKRYNCEQLVPTVKKVKLPYSKAVVSIPIRRAQDCIVSLLTDPRAQDADYLFWNNDPLAAPPETVTWLADLNTGDAYLETYKKRITKPNQVALPILIYIDGASTGQFSDLPVTAVKIALGIHKQSTRKQEWAWREIGWVPEVRKERARGKKIFKDSMHLESHDAIVIDGEGDEMDDESDTDSEDADGAVKAQDFHTILAEILKSFVELQETGFMWDLVYKVSVLDAVARAFV